MNDFCFFFDICVPNSAIARMNLNFILSSLGIHPGKLLTSDHHFRFVDSVLNSLGHIPFNAHYTQISPSLGPGGDLEVLIEGPARIGRRESWFIDAMHFFNRLVKQVQQASAGGR